MDAKNIKWSIVSWLIVLAILAVAISGLAGFILHTIPKHLQSEPEIALTILLFSGVVTFVAVLTITVSVLTALGLSNPRRAFGMPEGTIRAVIALSLILIFSIMSVFLYQTLRSPETTQTILTKAQFGEIPAKEIIFSRPADDQSEFFEVRRRLDPTESSDDFAKQLLTTISTLVVAVAGFYFGTRAVSVARGAEAPVQPVIRKLTPPEGKQGEEFPMAEILGKNFASPKTVKLVLESNESNEMTFGSVLSSATRIQGSLNIPAAQEKGTYALIVVNTDGGEDRLANAFTVTQKDQAV